MNATTVQLLSKLSQQFSETRRLSERLCEPLAVEDFVVQSMPDASPTRWHLAHTTWFFETFVLAQWEPGREPVDPRYQYLFNSYYESVGQNWERAALIKARACAGDLVTGEAILNGLAPFVWRKYLDFAAVADVQAMKRQINAYRGHGEIAVEGHNIKIGRGGIREIEFFAQTQQLIAGGRDPGLRDRDTLTTLDKLAAKNPAEMYYI